MMQLTYNLQDAQQWAAFSGDFNPIHFEMEAAAKLGISGLCVHGMRALLDIKTELGACLIDTLPPSGGFVFSSRLREPVICEADYELKIVASTRNAQLQLNSTLRDSATGRSCISSKLAMAQMPQLIPASVVYCLSSETLQALSAAFPAVNNGHVQPWSFLDAVLFQQLLNAPATLDTVREILPELFCDNPAMGLGDIFSQVQVVQTHHEIHFCRSLIGIDHDCRPYDALRYAILPTLIMGDKPSGLILCARLQAWRGAVPLLTAAVTLKTGPIPEKIQSANP